MGGVWHQAGCCCACPEPCAFCDNCPPTSITLTISGWSNCSGCYGPAGDGNYYKWTTALSSAVVNTSHTLTQSSGSNSCVWIKLTSPVTPQPVISWYSDSGCTSFLGSYSNFGGSPTPLSFTVRRQSGGWLINGALGVIGANQTPSLFIFNGFTGASTGDCENDPSSVSNSNLYNDTTSAACGAGGITAGGIPNIPFPQTGFAFPVGNGGTATITIP